MASGSITSQQIDWEIMETVTDLIFLGSKITADGDCSHEIKRHLLLGRKSMTNLRKWESEVAQSCTTICDPMDCSLPGSSIHGIFQARVLESVVISFSRVSSWPRDWTWVSCIAGRHYHLSQQESPQFSSVAQLCLTLCHPMNRSYFMANRWGNNGNRDFIFDRLQNHCRLWLQPWN